MVEAGKKYELNDLEIKIYPSEKMVKVPKLRIDIEEC